MDMEREIRKLYEFLHIDYIMSDEIDRVPNAIKDKRKCLLMKKAYVLLDELLKGNSDANGTIKGDDPDFPKSHHIIIVRFNHGIDDISFIDEMKGKLVEVITDCDELLISANLKNEVEFVFGYEDMYTEKETI